MSKDLSIPMLPCVALGPILDFYELLGFEATHKQESPYVYAALERNGAQVHFHGMKHHDPQNAFTGCLILVDEVERLHEGFASALRGAFGKVPIKGLPRITRMRTGQTRFTVVDPSGNSITFIQRDEPEGYGDDDVDEANGASHLVKALKLARRLRDFKNDDQAAAKVLDAALRKSSSETALERARALAWRIELAFAMGDESRATALVTELRKLSLSGADREALRDDLAAVAKLAGDVV